jgi:hypothetical protein
VETSSHRTLLLFRDRALLFAVFAVLAVLFGADLADRADRAVDLALLRHLSVLGSHTSSERQMLMPPIWHGILPA